MPEKTKKTKELCPWENCPIFRFYDCNVKILSRFKKNLPEDVINHFANARREVLLAFRSFIDKRLREIEEPAKAKKKAQKIKVE